MPPARSLDSGVVGPITGAPYVDPAGRLGSVRLYEFTMKRSDAGASNVFGYGEIQGAKIAMTAKTRTTAAPAIPRRLCRMLSQERLTRNRSCFRIPEPVSLATGASTSETDTRIEHSVQNVGDDVAQDDQHGDQIQDRSREHVVLLEDRLKQVPAHPVVGEDLLQNDRPPDHEAEADRQRRHYRQIGVPSDVAVAYLSRRQALRARGQDEVFAEDLQHRGLHEEDRARRTDQDEGEHRQRTVHDDVRRLEQETSPGQRREVLRRPRRITVSVEGEDRDREPERPQENQADPEGRHVVEKQTRDDREAFRLAAVPRDEPANRDPDQVLRDQCAAEQEQGPRQRDGENLGDRQSL